MNKAYKTHRQGEALSTSNEKYAACLVDLFSFLARHDEIEEGQADLTTRVAYKGVDEQRTATIKSKASGILAGLEELEFLISERQLPWEIDFLAKDGERVSAGDEVLKIRASVSDLLKYERIVLNLIQRMSGIASYTKSLVDHISDSSAPLLCPTRKTLWSLLDKKAVLIGGGGTHRLTLENAILLKENHLNQKLGLEEIITSAIKSGQGEFIEVEVENHDQAMKAAEALDSFSPSIVMLDNFSPSEAAKTTNEVREKFPQIAIELSGGINENNLKEYAAAKPDIISMGALTNESRILDLTMLVD